MSIFRPDIIPFDEATIQEKGQGFYYKGKEFVHHSRLHHSQIAFHRFSEGQIVILLLVFVLLGLSFVINWHLTTIMLFAFLTFLYFIDLFFNLYLIYRSFSKSTEIHITYKEITARNEWPLYTVLCPLYKEWQVVPQFVKAINDLDYPKNKLQVLLLLEEDDKETIEKVATQQLPSFFETVIIPDSKPKTKPKACNYGLQKTKGEYVVIYDAEDVPDPLQLKKVVLAFEEAGDKTVCIQAKLNFYNPYQNLLTRVFTAEYSLWFDLILTGLQSINAPIPLGGTSNHFKTHDLFKLKGWDAFNVTEDCDLGLRLTKYGYTTAIVDSTTHEEANSSYKNWLGQRSRWIKGYIQSYLVHMRKPFEFSVGLKTPHLFTFQLIVGGKILSMLINPLLWILTIAYFGFRSITGPFIQSLFPGPLLYIAVFSAVIGNFLYFYYYMIGCAKREYYDLIPFGFLIPIYWLMMSVSCWIAIQKIIVSPHYWFKTKHGLHYTAAKNTSVETRPNTSNVSLAI